MSSLESAISGLQETIDSVANASVMSQEHAADLQQRLKDNPELLEQLGAVAQRRSSRTGTDKSRGKGPDLEALSKAIIDKLLKPAAKGLETERDRALAKAETELNAIKARASTLADREATTGACARRKEAKRTFDYSLGFVVAIVSKINKAQSRINGTNTKINAIAFVDSDDDEPDEAVTKKITELQTARDQLTKEKKQLQLQLFSHFDETLGGAEAVSKHDKRPLVLPKNLDKVNARQITDAFQTYISHRAAEYYAILPYLKYTLHSYNPKDGTYAEPPNKATNYGDVPECLRAAYSKQSELLYREILQCIQQAEMARITSTFNCGLNKDKKARCPVDDGIMACYCLLAKYGRNDAHSLTDLEEHFIRSPHHFQLGGSPANKVEKLRPYLLEALELGVQLKASQVMLPVIDILSEKHPRFAVVLNKYMSGGDTPSDCAATLEQMYSDIVRTCEGIERASGANIWQPQTHAHSAQFKGKGGKGKGKGKQGSGKRSYHTANQTSQDKGGTGKGKGKGKGGKAASRNNCNAQGCGRPSGNFKFCLECFKRGMEQGHITCYDGFKQPITRANHSDKGKFGFTPEQMESLSALSGHLAESISGQQQKSTTIDANTADPFTGRQLALPPVPAPTPPSEPHPDSKRKPIWARMGECNETKRQRKDKAFLQQLGFQQ